MDPLSRRGFLSRMALFSAAAFFPFPRLTGRVRKSVLVAGGGFSGLYAADLLKRKGYAVTLLESSARLGGKAFGGTVAGHPYDFGCQAYSKDMHRVRALGQRFGLTVVPKPEQSAFYMRGREAVTGKELEVLQKDFEKLEDLGRSQYAQVDDPQLRPQLAAQSVMSWARPHLSEAAIPLYRSTFAAEWCATPEEVSLLHYLEYQRGFDGEGEEMDFRFREGLFRAAEGLAHEVKDCAELNCALEKVEASAQGVKVRAGGRDFTADYLVLAVPLTKLRDIPIEGVDASALRGSLESIQGAAVRKVLVAFERPFWRERAREGAFDVPCGMAIMDNSDLSARRYSLAVFLGGPAALEAPSREQVLARLADLLGPEAMRPLDYHEQAWLGDEHLCGGYAANRSPTRGSSAAMPSSLGTRIYLAGSDAAREFPSYVEGALFAAEQAVSGIVKSAIL